MQHAKHNHSKATEISHTSALGV